VARPARAVALVLAAACSSHGSATAVGAASDGGTDDGAVDAGEVAWTLSLDGTTGPRSLSPALLGQYDLSGALFSYDQVQGLGAALAPAGFHDWRIGLGRWESTTQLLPTLTDGTSCASTLQGLPAQAFAPAGTTDLDLIAARDWFVDDGNAVTAADLQDDARYDLAYVRSAIDAAVALGAEPYVGIDHMPRAFAANRTPSRTIAAWPDACDWTWVNTVSNGAPAAAYLGSDAFFAQAVVGMVQRVVEGTAGQMPRAASYWEIWNEPELAYSWPASDTNLATFFTMTIQSLVALGQYRSQSSNPAAQGLHFGLASFAHASTAAQVIATLDSASAHVPVDFFSFHSYSNDPLAIVADVQTVVSARAASKNYTDAELSLSEWGPDLSSTPDPTTMDLPLLAATVIARAATLGLDRSYHAIFWDFYAGIPWGLVDNSGKPTPLLHAYELLAGLVGSGAARLVVGGATDGSLDAGDAAVIASRDPAGGTHVLLVQRGTAARTATVVLGGTPATPKRVRVFDDPTTGVTDVPPSAVVSVPAASIVLLDL
jgi:hypothetical protein